MKVHLLIGKNLGFYEYCYLPILKYNKQLRILNIDVKIFTSITDAVFESDYFIYTSTYNRELKKTSGNGEEVTAKTYELLYKANKIANNVYYFDTSDSTSAYGQFRYLSYVDKYLKPYILKEKELYREKFYRDRIFCDYYNKKFNIIDNKKAPPRYIPERNELKKIQLAWNQIYSDFGIFSNYQRWLESKIRKKLPNPVNLINPKKKRDIDISFRGSIDYGKNTINYQRIRVNEIIKGLGVDTDTVTRRKYIKELRNCKIGISPFGYGEVCFRDFEIILNGAALVKPDMSHMVTWPDLYQPNKTFIPFNWDFSDLETKIRNTIEDGSWANISQKAQKVIKEYIAEKTGEEKFINHFINILDIGKH